MQDQVVVGELRHREVVGVAVVRMSRRVGPKDARRQERAALSGGINHQVVGDGAEEAAAVLVGDALNPEREDVLAQVILDAANIVGGLGGVHLGRNRCGGGPRRRSN